jgi:hypothetical protein
MRPYASSAGKHGQPGRSDVDGRVDVPIMSGAAISTLPVAHRKGHLYRWVRACRACFARRVPPIDYDQLTPVPCALVLQHRPHFSPTCIGDRAGQAMIADHVPHAQILDHDHLVFTDEIGSELVQEIPSPIGDPGMGTGDVYSCLFPVSGALSLPGEQSLGAGEPCPIATLEPRVEDFLSGGQRDQGGNPGIDPDGGFRLGKRFDRAFTQQRYEPSARRISRHGHRGRLRVRRQRTRPAYGQRFAHPRQRQLSVSPPEPATGVLGGLTGPFPGFEFRITRSFFPECDECALEMTERLLKGYGRHIAEICEIVTPLPFRQHRGSLLVRDTLLPLHSGSALIQRKVPDHADAAERPRQLRGLISRGIEAVLVGSLHQFRHTLMLLTRYVILQERHTGRKHGASLG